VTSGASASRAALVRTWADARRGGGARPRASAASLFEHRLIVEARRRRTRPDKAINNGFLYA